MATKKKSSKAPTKTWKDHFKQYGAVIAGSVLVVAGAETVKNVTMDDPAPVVEMQVVEPHAPITPNIPATVDVNPEQAPLDKVEEKTDAIPLPEIKPEEIPNPPVPVVPETGEPKTEQKSEFPLDLTAPTEIVKVRKLKKYYLLTERHDGKIELRTGGNITWRYNNPGKLIQNDFTISKGSLGSDGKYAVFPSYERGKLALHDLLFVSDDYKNLSLKEAIAKFAPKTKGNDPVKYASIIAKRVGVDSNFVIGNYTDKQKEETLKAIEAIERFTKGKVQIFDNQADFDKNGY